MGNQTPASDFVDEPTNPEAPLLSERELVAVATFRAACTPEVLTWTDNMAKSARKSQKPEIVAGFEALCELAQALSGGAA